MTGNSAPPGTRPTAGSGVPPGRAESSTTRYPAAHGSAGRRKVAGHRPRRAAAAGTSRRRSTSPRRSPVTQPAAVQVHADRPQARVEPVLGRHLAPGRVEPRQVLAPVAARRPGGPRRRRADAAPGAARRSASSRAHQAEHVLGLGGRRPVEPRGRVVLAVGVVVAALGTPALVAGHQHRRAGRQQQRRRAGCAPAAAAASSTSGGRRVALDPAVVRAVVVGAVAVVLAVGLVVLVLVGDQVAHGEAVVRGDEVDRRDRQAAVVAVQVRRAGQPVGQVAHAVGARAPRTSGRCRGTCRSTPSTAAGTRRPGSRRRRRPTARR